LFAEAHSDYADPARGLALFAERELAAAPGNDPGSPRISDRGNVRDSVKSRLWTSDAHQQLGLRPDCWTYSG